MLSVIMLNVIILSVVMVNVIILSVVMLIVIMLSVVMMSVIMLSVVMLNVIMPSDIMLSVIMLSVVMLNVVAPQLISDEEEKGFIKFGADGIEWDQSNEKTAACNKAATALIALGSGWPTDGALMAQIHDSNFPPKVAAVQVTFFLAMT
jgi:hypothetical protein